LNDEYKGCESVIFQNSAKKLLVLKIKEISEPKTQAERQMDYFMNRSDAAPMLNSMKTSNLRTGSVEFNSVQKFESPDMPTDYSLVCTANAKIKLQEEAANRLRALPVVAAALQLNENKIELEIVYTKEEKNGETLVGLAFPNPLMDMMLSVALRSDKEEPGNTDKKDETTPGDAGKKEEKSE
jgi:hypothetical protein